MNRNILIFHLQNILLFSHKIVKIVNRLILYLIFKYKLCLDKIEILLLKYLSRFQKKKMCYFAFSVFVRGVHDPISPINLSPPEINFNIMLIYFKIYLNYSYIYFFSFTIIIHNFLSLSLLSFFILSQKISFKLMKIKNLKLSIIYTTLYFVFISLFHPIIYYILNLSFFSFFFSLTCIFCCIIYI